VWYQENGGQQGDTGSIQWIGPSGKVEVNFPFCPTPGPYGGTYCWDIGIGAGTPLGTWSVQLVTNGVLNFSLPFTIGPGAAIAGVVSAASYQSTVAPDSLATIFGSQLSDSTATAQQLDASGNLPTQLADIRVEINGQLVQLLYVSPSQINCLIPKNLSAGTTTVAVQNVSGTTRATGAAPIALVAPAIFTSDSSGTGPGAIINAVTYALGPFSVFTLDNAG